MVEPFSGEQVYFEDQTFERLVLQNGLISHLEFEGCRFVRCSFFETRMEQCHFVDCVFEDCDLSLCAVPGCTFVATRFRDSQLVGMNWTAASWPKTGLLRSLDFKACTLDHSTFLGLSLREIDIIECMARNVDLAEADLTKANCAGTDFAESRFLHTNLAGADFSRARNYAIAPSLNLLKGTRFALPESMALLHGLDIILVE